jgi:hypothetical protein
MKCPDGMKIGEDECLLLKKTIYGLVQSARVFNQKFVNVVTSEEIGMEQSMIDQCLFIKQGKESIVILLLYVDDSIIFGTRSDIDEILNQIKETFTISIEGKLSDFLGCNIIKHPEEPKCWLLQPNLIEKLDKEYEDHKLGRVPTTLGTPKLIIYKAKKDDDLLNDKLQFKFRSGVGSLMHLLKHSRPELSNCIRQLSKCLGKAKQEHMEELTRIIKWVLATKEKGLKMEPKLKINENGEIIFEIRGVCDAAWNVDKTDCLSVTGYIVYFMVVPISWKSKTQSHVTLSSTESEYVALSEMVKEIQFIEQIVESLGMKVYKPIKVMIDNVGAIYMSRSNTNTTSTRHVNMRYHYVKELVRGGEIEVTFVRTEDNEADIMTKNVIKQTFEKHMSKLVETVPENLLQITKK